MRSGLFTAEDNAAWTRYRDNAMSGIEFIALKTGIGAAPGMMVCITPGVCNYADLALRTDLLGIPGARMWVQDVGTDGSEWISIGGAWRPNGPIYGTATPEAAITAPVGSEFINTAGGTGTTKYLKETGTGNTGWVAK